jgi:tetratricopeptide (TPR) repeat protein
MLDDERALGSVGRAGGDDPPSGDGVRGGAARAPRAVTPGVVSFADALEDAGPGGLAPGGGLDPALGAAALQKSVVSGLVSLCKVAAAVGAIVAGLCVSYLTYDQLRVDGPLARRIPTPGGRGTAGVAPAAPKSDAAATVTRVEVAPQEASDGPPPPPPEAADPVAAPPVTGAEDPERLRAAAITAQERGDLAEATRLWTWLLEREPRHAVAMVNLAAIALARGHGARAEELLTEALAAAPDLVAAHVNLGHLHARRGAFEPAAASFRAALALDPGHAQARWNLVAVLERAGTPEAALEELTSAGWSTRWPGLQGRLLLRLGRAEQARSILEQALTADRDDDDLTIDLAVALTSLGQLEAARAHLDTVIQRSPGSARAYNNRGNVHAASGRLVEAKRDYERALELEPGYADAHYNYALLSERYGQYLYAIEGYERVLEIDPAHARALNNLGRIYLRAGEPARALEHLDRGLGVTTRLPETHMNKGLALLALGRAPLARASLERSLELLPPDSEDVAWVRRLLADMRRSPR